MSVETVRAKPQRAKTPTKNERRPAGAGNKQSVRGKPSQSADKKQAKSAESRGKHDLRGTTRKSAQTAAATSTALDVNEWTNGIQGEIHRKLDEKKSNFGDKKSDIKVNLGEMQLDVEPNTIGSTLVDKINDSVQSKLSGITDTLRGSGVELKPAQNIWTAPGFDNSKLSFGGGDSESSDNDGDSGSNVRPGLVLDLPPDFFKNSPVEESNVRPILVAPPHTLSEDTGRDGNEINTSNGTFIQKGYIGNFKSEPSHLTLRSTVMTGDNKESGYPIPIFTTYFKPNGINEGTGEGIVNSVAGGPHDGENDANIGFKVPFDNDTKNLIQEESDGRGYDKRDIEPLFDVGDMENQTIGMKTVSIPLGNDTRKNIVWLDTSAAKNNGVPEGNWTKYAEFNAEDTGLNWVSMLRAEEVDSVDVPVLRLADADVDSVNKLLNGTGVQIPDQPHNQQITSALMAGGTDGAPVIPQSTTPIANVTNWFALSGKP